MSTNEEAIAYGILETFRADLRRRLVKIGTDAALAAITPAIEASAAEAVKDLQIFVYEDLYKMQKNVLIKLIKEETP